MGENLFINKPKKSDKGTYICPIRGDGDAIFKFDLENSKIIRLKYLTLTDDEFYVYIQNKSCFDFMYDLNQKIIEIVKSNCGDWFKNNMNVDLIDEYYTNTLVYDKKYGDLIKLKCVGGVSFFEVEKTYDLSVSLQHLRFYKQKFTLECSIISADACKAVFFLDEEEESVDNSSDIDSVEPDYEVVESMKNDLLEEVRELSDFYGEKLKSLREFDEKIRKSCDIHEIAEISEHIKLFSQ